MASSTDNIGPSVVLCSWIMIGITTFCIGIRFYTRFFVTNVQGWGDLICIAGGYTFAMVISVTSLTETHYGLGRHVATVAPEDLVNLLKVNFAGELAYIWSFVLSKLSFVFFYLNIFPSKKIQTSCKILGVVLIAELIEETAVVICQCRPVKKAWDIETPGKCLQLLPFFYVSFGIKFATDLVLFCLPMPMLGKLKINLGKKIGVILMFSLGLLVCIISIIRVTFLKNTSTDLTFILPPELNWSVIEVCSLVICACIPSFRAFLRLFPAISQFLDLSTSSHESKFTSSVAKGSAYRLESRNRRTKTDNFASSQNLPIKITSVLNESQEDILQSGGKDGIKVTTNVRVDHIAKERSSEPSFIFDSNV